MKVSVDRSAKEATCRQKQVSQSNQANDKGIALRRAVWLTVGSDNFGGPVRIALLASVAQCGPIAQAIKAIKMSHKATWDAIDTTNNLAGEWLTRGMQLATNFKLIELEYRCFIDQLICQACQDRPAV